MKVKLSLKQQSPLKKLKISKSGIQVVEPWKLEPHKIKSTARNILDQFKKLDVQPFLELVSKSEYPDYYHIIEHPISLKEIKQKIEKAQYAQIDDFKADINLMLSNCLKYNVPSSYLGKLAISLQTQFSKLYEKAREAKNSGEVDVMQDLFDCIEADDFKSFETLFDPSLVNELHRSTMFDDEFTWGLMHASCYFGRTRFIEFLIENKGGVELQDTWYGGRALAWATFGKHPKICKLLIEKYGADRNARNNHGQTAFDLVEDKTGPQWREFFRPEPAPRKTPSTSFTIKIPPQSEKQKPATQVYQTPTTQRFVIPATIRPATGSRKVAVDTRASKSYTPQLSVPVPTQNMFQSYVKSANPLPQQLLVKSIGVCSDDNTFKKSFSFSAQDIADNFQGHFITLAAKKIDLSLELIDKPTKVTGFHSCQLNVKTPDGMSVQQRQEPIEFKDGDDYKCEILLNDHLNALEFVVQQKDVQHSFVLMVQRL